jgi:hypothetical protein
MSGFAGNDQGTISRALGLLGVVLLLVVLAHRQARRAGGWAVVRRRLRHEAALTGAAFTGPVRGWIRYRRRVRALRQLLGDPESWRTAERAVREAHGILGGGGRPYGVLADSTVVGVLIAGREVPDPPAPWVVDEADPRLWWVAREDVVGARPQVPSAPPVLLAAVGTDGGRALLLDLAGGPALTAVDGDARNALALVQALAAQLDARLPAGSVTVAADVHPRHPGPAPAEALRAAAVRAGQSGPAFVVCAEPPPELPVGTGVRVLAYGNARGNARLLTAMREGTLVLHGLPVEADAAPLPRAVSRVLRALPPYEPPGPDTPAPLHPTAATAPAPTLGRSALGAPAPVAAASIAASAKASATASSAADDLAATDPSAAPAGVGLSAAASRPARTASSEPVGGTVRGT